MSAINTYVQRGVHTIFVVVAVLLFIFGGAGSSLRWAGSAIVARGAQLPRSTWDLPGPGIEWMFLALQGEFLTTGPPGTSPEIFPLIENLKTHPTPPSLIQHIHKVSSSLDFKEQALTLPAGNLAH